MTYVTYCAIIRHHHLACCLHRRSGLHLLTPRRISAHHPPDATRRDEFRPGDRFAARPTPDSVGTPGGDDGDDGDGDATIVGVESRGCAEAACGRGGPRVDLGALEDNGLKLRHEMRMIVCRRFGSLWSEEMGFLGMGLGGFFLEAEFGKKEDFTVGCRLLGLVVCVCVCV